MLRIDLMEWLARAQPGERICYLNDDRNGYAPRMQLDKKIWDDAYMLAQSFEIVIYRKRDTRRTHRHLWQCWAQKLSPASRKFLMKLQNA